MIVQDIFNGISVIAVIISIAALILRGPKGPPMTLDDLSQAQINNLKGDPGAAGAQGPAGPQGPAGTMIVQCSPTSSGSNNCKGMIPGSLDVNGQLTSDTITTSGDITVGSPSNTWSQSGNITTSGNINTSANINTSGDLIVGSPSNMWSPTGNITSNTITTSGDLIVGSPSNMWSPSGNINPSKIIISSPSGPSSWDSNGIIISGPPSGPTSWDSNGKITVNNIVANKTVQVGYGGGGYGGTLTVNGKSFFNGAPTYKDVQSPTSSCFTVSGNSIFNYPAISAGAGAGTLWIQNGGIHLGQSNIYGDSGLTDIDNATPRLCGASGPAVSC